MESDGGRELSIRRAQEHVIDEVAIGRAVEIERNMRGGIDGVSVTGVEKSLFDDLFDVNSDGILDLPRVEIVRKTKRGKRVEAYDMQIFPVNSAPSTQIAWMMVGSVSKKYCDLSSEGGDAAS